MFWTDFLCILLEVRIHSYIMDEIMKRKLFFTKIPTTVDTETEPEKLRNTYQAVAQSRRLVRNDFPDPNLFHIKAKKVALPFKLNSQQLAPFNFFLFL